MENYSATYTQQRTFEKYDANNIIGYLHEEIVGDFIPEGNDEPTTGYKYTGTERDGGTIMPCKDPSSYNEVTNAIIRADISESEEQAIQRHYINNPQAYAEEWRNYNDLCERAKATAKLWLSF